MTGVVQNNAAELQRSNTLMRQLLTIGTSLSTEQDFSCLAERVVREAKSLCHADAGLFYLQNTQGKLDCTIVQIDSLQVNQNGIQVHSLQNIPIAQITCSDDAGKLQSLAALAALTGTLLQWSDRQPGSLWSDDWQFDHCYGYRSVSCLAVPIKDSQGTLIGVLQLLNAMHPETSEVIAFDEMLCEVMQNLAGLAANALNYQRLLQHEAAWAKGERELQIGHKIQLDFLPETLPNVEGWEIAARFYPARDVAGDFYDAFLIGHGRVGVVIADVCDKGVGAALFMSLFRSMLRILAQQNYSTGLFDVLSASPGKAKKAVQDTRSRLPSIGTQALKNAMERTNTYIAETHFRTNMFATIFFGVLDPATGKLIYINGGHESPFICDAQGKIKERLKSTGPAVGVFPGADFRIEMTQLEPGDVLLGYTDGVPDARNPQHELYTEQQLCTLMESEPPTSAIGVIDRIDAAVHNHIADTDPFDDITLIAVRRQ